MDLSAPRPLSVPHCASTVPTLADFPRWSKPSPWPGSRIFALILEPSLGNWFPRGSSAPWVLLYPPTSSNFLLVASFGRSAIRLNEDSMGLLLQSCLGVTTKKFHLIHLSGWMYRFSVSCKDVGFMVYKLKKLYLQTICCVLPLGKWRPQLGERFCALVSWARVRMDNNGI